MRILIKTAAQFQIRLDRDTIKPDLERFVNYQIENIDDKDIIQVNIAEGTKKPYYLAKKGLRPEGVYVRQGLSAASVSEEYIREMIIETDGRRFDEIRSLE